MIKIKNMMRDNKKILLMSVFLLIFLTACVSRQSDGTIHPDDVIGLDLPFSESFSDSWFNIIVWPITQLINIVAKYSDAGIGIFVVTILLNFGTAAMSIKSQVANQKMQMIQPEIQKIQAKYKDKKDQNSQMRMYQETQTLYKKYTINPMGTLLTTFIQFPIIIAVYQAVLRSEAVIEGSFLGINLTHTPMSAFTNFSNESLPVIIIFIAMAVFQFISFKIPQMLSKRRKERNHIKTKEYAQPKQKGGMQNSMNMMMYFSVGMVVVFAINWPLGMSLYWLISSFTRIAQNIIVDKFFIKDI
ncbi:MAG: YidC/Oxa1 family membrane protein insertase [Breznakia sp.]